MNTKQAIEDLIKECFEPGHIDGLDHRFDIEDRRRELLGLAVARLINETFQFDRVTDDDVELLHANASNIQRDLESNRNEEAPAAKEEAPAEDEVGPVLTHARLWNYGLMDVICPFCGKIDRKPSRGPDINKHICSKCGLDSVIVSFED
jgi:hypothetical protein